MRHRLIRSRGRCRQRTLKLRLLRSPRSQSKSMTANSPSRQTLCRENMVCLDGEWDKFGWNGVQPTNDQGRFLCWGSRVQRITHCSSDLRSSQLDRSWVEFRKRKSLRRSSRNARWGKQHRRLPGSFKRAGLCLHRSWSRDVGASAVYENSSFVYGTGTDISWPSSKKATSSLFKAAWESSKFLSSFRISWAAPSSSSSENSTRF